MKQTLKQTVKQQVESIQLSAEQLQTLDAMQLFTPQKSQRSGWRYPLIGVAAMILLFVWLLPNKVLLFDKGATANEIAVEVVANHLRQKPLEVNAGKFASVREYFTQLDFVPIESKLLRGSKMVLLGGRYCSLQGVTAAQLRFQSNTVDQVKTLYQVGYDPAVFKSLPDIDSGEEPVTVYSSGVKVTLWVEKDVLFALTED